MAGTSDCATQKVRYRAIVVHRSDLGVASNALHSQPGGRRELLLRRHPDTILHLHRASFVIVPSLAQARTPMGAAPGLRRRCAEWFRDVVRLT
jgi:hypothetical protein